MTRAKHLTPEQKQKITQGLFILGPGEALRVGRVSGPGPAMSIRDIIARGLTEDGRLRDTFAIRRDDVQQTVWVVRKGKKPCGGVCRYPITIAEEVAVVRAEDVPSARDRGMNLRGAEARARLDKYHYDHCATREWAFRSRPESETSFSLFARRAKEAARQWAKKHHGGVFQFREDADDDGVWVCFGPARGGTR